MLLKLTLILAVAISSAAHAQTTTVITKKGSAPATTKSVKTEVAPQFRGGQTTLQRFINNRMQYPEQAREQNVQGDVIIGFRVDEKGDCSDFKVVKGLGAGCDEEALRVAQEMPRWIPAQSKGKAVAVNMHMPITFKINNELELENTSRTKNKWR